MIGERHQMPAEYLNNTTLAGALQSRAMAATSSRAKAKVPRPVQKVPGGEFRGHATGTEI